MEDYAQDRFANRCQFGAWSVRQIVAAYTGNASVKFVLPPFQRDFVWKLEQQKGFIDSVRQGLPVGSLLLFGPPDEQNLRYIVDGLQRCTTLAKYIKERFKYVDDANLPVQEVDQLARLIVTDYKTLQPEQQDLVRGSLTRYIGDWFRSRQGFDAVHGFDPYELWNYLMPKRAGGHRIASGSLPDIVRPLLGRILDDVRAKLTIDDAQVPVIEFFGNQEVLPVVFERLNNEGTKLNKFDVLAAQWNDAEVNFRQEEIAAGVRRRYIELQDLGLEYHGPDISDLNADGYSFYLYEFVLGLGRVLKERYPRLYGRAQKSTAVDSIGFNLATLSAGLRITELGRLRGYFIRAFAGGDEQQIADVSDFAELVFEASACVLDWLSPALDNALFKNQRKNPHAEFQIAAIVATVARELLESEQPFKLRSARERDSIKKSLARLIPQHYWFELLNRSWQGSGDSTASRYVRERLYLEPVSRSVFEERLLQWHNDSLNSKQRTLDAISRGLLALALHADGAGHRAEDARVEPILDGIENKYALGNIMLLKGNGDALGRLGAPRLDNDRDIMESLNTRFQWIAERVSEALYEDID